jgi:hypothetical protein
VGTRYVQCIASLLFIAFGVTSLWKDIIWCVLILSPTLGNQKWKVTFRFRNGYKFRSDISIWGHFCFKEDWEYLRNYFIIDLLHLWEGFLFVCRDWFSGKDDESFVHF